MDVFTRNRLLQQASASRDRAASLLRRMEVQTAFARSFTAIQPDEVKEAWLPLLDEASSLFAQVEGTSGLEEAVAQAERILAPIGQPAKLHTIHCVGHGHIDMNWMWSWPETVAATHDTFASVLSLMDLVPGVTYSQSQASVYALIEKHHPDMFREIQKRVKEGVWEVSAVHWVEGDKNLAHGEALARHLLYTRRYFAEKFGLSPADCPLDWEPDTFGHAATLPGILAANGVKFYYCCRPGGGHDHAQVGDARPGLFWWEGPDGSRILVNRETTWYNSYIGIGDNIADPMVDFIAATGLRHWLNVYGIGNHGGGPTFKEVAYLQETMEWPIYPTVIFSTAKAYFEAIEPDLPSDLPVLKHELNYEFTGCYTSQSAIKRANRMGEAFCLDAETLALVAEKLGGPEAPQDRLREAWINVLFSQFHDILPGSGVVHTRNHATALFQETAALTGAVKKEAAKTLARRVNTLALLPPDAKPDLGRPYEAGAGRGAMITGYSAGVSALGPIRPIILWNPTDVERTEFVTVQLYDLPCDADLLVAQDGEGRKESVVFLDRSMDWGHDRITIAFAATVPALGCATYLILEGKPDQVPTQPEILSSWRASTPFFDLELDPGQSGIRSLKLKGSGQEILGLGVVRKTSERPVGMSSWVLGAEPEPPQPLPCLSSHIRRVWRKNSPNVDRVNAPGFVAEQKLAVPGTESKATLRAFIQPLSPRVDFELEVDWREIGTEQKGVPGLEVAFGGFPGATALFEAPFGTVERPVDGNEVPTLRFVHGFEGYGMTILQDSKYGHRCRPGEASFRVVRSSYDPDPTPEVGEQTVRFSVVFHETEPSKADLVRLGAALNHPLLVIPAPLQEGDLPPSLSLASVAGEGVVLTSLKKGEDGGVVARLVELEGREATATLRLDPLLGSFTQAESVNLMEQPDGGPAPDLEGEEVKVTLAPFQIRSVRLS